jgi:4-amino-4-deoxy-L-arabinose transferase-like glycosyltransferase
VVDSFAHRLPWWWYLQFLPLLAMPWAFTPMFWQGFARIDRKDQGLRFCVFWLLPVLLAFSCISGKRVHYLLPLVPAFSLVISRLLLSASESDWKKGHRYYAITLGLLGVLLALLPLVNGRLIHLKILLGLSPTWGLLVMGLALTSWQLSSRDAGQSVQRIAATTVFSLLLMAAGFFTINGIRYDTTPAARKIAALQAQHREVAIMTDKYHGQFQFTGRLEQPLRVIYGVAALQNYAVAHPDSYLVLTYKSNANVPDSLFEFRQPYKSSSMLGIVPGSLLKAHPELGRYLVP